MVRSGCTAMPGTEAMECRVFSSRLCVRSAGCSWRLKKCATSYVVSGTELACSYAMSRTDTAYVCEEIASTKLSLCGARYHTAVLRGVCWYQVASTDMGVFVPGGSNGCSATFHSTSLTLWSVPISYAMPGTNLPRPILYGP
eukprot:3940405-Rhodomonas_salina.2